MAEFPSLDESYAPFLHNPSDPGQKINVVFHLLAHGGYLTRVMEREKYFKIPNFEILSKIQPGIREFYQKIPIFGVDYTELAEAVEKEDFVTLGEQITKSLHNASLHYEYRITEDGSVVFRLRDDAAEIKENKVNESFVLEAYIHQLLVLTFQEKWKHNDYFLVSKDGKQMQAKDLIPKKKTIKEAFLSEDQKGMRIDLSFTPKRSQTNTHVRIEVKPELKNTKGILYNSLSSLKQIFDSNYHQDIIELKDTKEVINIGIAANTTHCCLSILTTEIKGGTYFKVDKLKHYGFRIVESGNTTVKVDHFSHGAERIVFTELPLNATAEGK